jgi:C4-dicarboxylate transporter DctM subunit
MLGIPIAYSLIIPSLVVMLIEKIPTLLVAQQSFALLNSYIIMAVPFFILAGELMTVSGMTQRIVNLTNSLIGHVRGGLAQVNIVGSILFAGLSGSSAADTAAIGAVLVPPMLAEKYSKPFTIAVTCASGCIGPIIPPSIFMILYGALTGVSVAELFLAGFLPGLLVGLSQMGLCYFYSYMGEGGVWPRPRATFKEFKGTVTGGIPAIILPVVIIGGILFGVFTPTEAGIVAVVYALIIGIFLYRSISFINLKATFATTVYRTSQVMMMTAGAGAFSWLLSSANFGPTTVKFLLAITTNPKIVLILLVISIAFISCFLDALPATLILVPVFFPLGKILGFQEVHFATVLIITIVLGGITPPVAPLLYIASSIADGSPSAAIRATLPFLLISYSAVILIIFVPQLTTFLPNFFLH